MKTPHGVIHCSFSKGAVSSDDVIIVIRPEDVVLSDGPMVDRENTFQGKVTNRIFLGEVIDYLIEAGDEEIRVRARPEWDFDIGHAVHVALPPAKCVGLAEGHEAASLGA